MGREWHIAIVDDEASVLRALSRLLGAHGVQSAPFSSGREFLARLRDDASFRPDCLLLDISMPDLNGLEVKERLRQLGQPLPVVFITAHGQSPLRERAMAAGAVAVLQKPVREEALLEAIQNACAA